MISSLCSATQFTPRAISLTSSRGARAFGPEPGPFFLPADPTRIDSGRHCDPGYLAQWLRSFAGNDEQELMEASMMLHLTENSKQWIRAAIEDAEYVRIVAHEAPPVHDGVSVWHLVGELRRPGHGTYQSQIHAADGLPLIFASRTEAEKHLARLLFAVAR